MGKLKSVYCHTTRFYSKTLTFTSFYCGNYVILHWYARNKRLKNNYHCFGFRHYTGDVGGFLQVQHYWGVNIHCKLLNPGLWKLWTIHWSHHMSTTKLTPLVVSEDEWDTKEGPSKSVKNVLYVLWCAKGTSRNKATSNSKKNQAHSLIRYWVTLVWRHEAVS